MTQQRDDIVGRLEAHAFRLAANAFDGVGPGLAHEAAAEITRLRAIVARIQGAAKTIMIGEADELRRLREQHREWHLAIQSLDSERDANAILTEENERLRAENAEAEQRGARAGLEAAARVADDIDDAAESDWKTRYDLHDQGRAAGAFEVATAIRALDPTKLEIDK